MARFALSDLSPAPPRYLSVAFRRRASVDGASQPLELVRRGGETLQSIAGQSFHGQPQSRRPMFRESASQTVLNNCLDTTSKKIVAYPLFLVVLRPSLSEIQRDSVDDLLKKQADPLKKQIDDRFKQS